MSQSQGTNEDTEARLGVCVCDICKVSLQVFSRDVTRAQIFDPPGMGYIFKISITLFFSDFGELEA